MKEEIIARILADMGKYGTDVITELKESLHRNLYGVKIEKQTTEIVVASQKTNEYMLKLFERDYRIAGKSEKTIMAYMRETLRFLQHTGKHFSGVTGDDINNYLAILLKTDISTTTVDNTRKYIKQFFNWLYENEYIEKNPFRRVRPIKRQEKKKEYLTEQEFVVIRDNCRNSKELALIEFLYSTGLRVSELTGLKVKDIDFMSGAVNIYAHKTNSWRKVYLEAGALKHLIDYINARKGQSEYVFCNTRKSTDRYGRMGNQSVENLIKSVCIRAGVDKHCTVHLFRKSLATRLYRKGADVAFIAYILGHKSTKTTEQYYLSLVDEDIRYKFNKMVFA